MEKLTLNVPTKEPDVGQGGPGGPAKNVTSPKGFDELPLPVWFNWHPPRSIWPVALPTLQLELEGTQTHCDGLGLIVAVTPLTDCWPWQLTAVTEVGFAIFRKQST